MHLKYASEFELALFHLKKQKKQNIFSFLVICLIKPIWQVIKKKGKKKRVNEFDSALYFSAVDTTSTQMIGSARGSHGCACHCGWVIAGWSSDCVHRHACH